MLTSTRVNVLVDDCVVVDRKQGMHVGFDCVGNVSVNRHGGQSNCVVSVDGNVYDKNVSFIRSIIRPDSMRTSTSLVDV